MEPSAAIAIIETDLRELARSVLGEKFGAKWIEAVLDTDAIAELEGRREEERKRRSPAIVVEDLIAYTHAYELQTMIERRWELFATSLGKKREFTVLMDKVNDYRNAPAHSRELLPYERSLLEGIAGEVRTKVIAYRSSQAPDASYYPIIESVRDSFGTSASLRSPIHAADVTVTGRRLHVGDVVRFECRGWDPQSRKLTWVLSNIGAETIAKAAGSEVVIELVVRDQNVGAGFYPHIRVVSAGRYHRHEGYDQEVIFHYAVDPPGPS